MEKTKEMPWWVFLAFSSIETRKGALNLIGICILFALYCVPWSLYAPGHEWAGKLFRIHDWSWFAMMVPMSLWYVLSFRWVERNGEWA